MANGGGDGMDDISNSLTPCDPTSRRVSWNVPYVQDYNVHRVRQRRLGTSRNSARMVENLRLARRHPTRIYSIGGLAELPVICSRYLRAVARFAAHAVFPHKNKRKHPSSGKLQFMHCRLVSRTTTTMRNCRAIECHGRRHAPKPSTARPREVGLPAACRLARYLALFAAQRAESSLSNHRGWCLRVLLATSPIHACADSCLGHAGVHKCLTGNR